MNGSNLGVRWRDRVLLAIAAVSLSLAALAGVSEPPAATSSDSGGRHFDLKETIVTRVLERFANDPKTSVKDVRELLEYDFDAGLWVLTNRSLRSDDLVGCASYFVTLPNVEDAQAIRIAQVYFLWEGMRPEAFDMAKHDPVRHAVLTRMLAQARTQEAKTKIQEFINTFEGERDEFYNPPDPIIEKLEVP